MIIDVIIALEISGHEELYLLMTGGRNHLTVYDCRDQPRRDKVEVQEARSPEFVVLVSELHTICNLVCPTSHSYMNHPRTEKKKLAELVRLEGVAIPSHFVFVGHGYLQHGACGWREFHCICYHNHLIPSSYELQDAAVFA